MVREKNIKIYVVEAGQKINIENNLYFDILWPSSDNIIAENSINNNSLVCKLKYKNFSMLFTGDIEEIAEREIIEKYKNNSDILQSKILKVAHHGSKTSSIEEFIKKVNPRISLVGVGEKNNFGHPSESVLKILQDVKSKIHRTDLCGEIAMETNGNWIKIKNVMENKKEKNSSMGLT